MITNQPFVHEGRKFLAIALPVQDCPVCKRPMLNCRAWTYANLVSAQSIRGFHAAETIEKQLERAGIQAPSGIEDKNYHQVCLGCRTSDGLQVECALCNEMRPSSQIKESFGDPAEHLCKTCYATVPAQRWEAAVEGLREQHKYDWE